MNVLFLTHRLPYAPNRGDRIRAHHILRVLALHHAVHLVSFVHDDEESAEVGKLDALAASVAVARITRWRSFSRAIAMLPQGAPLTHAVLDAPEITGILNRVVGRHPPDVVLAYCSGMARFALAPPLQHIPFVLDMVDVDSEKWAALAARSSAFRRWVFQREARRLGSFEAEAARRAIATTVINDRERAAVLRLEPSANVQVVSNGIDVPHFAPRRTAAPSANVVFTGVFNYQPNEDGAVWMAQRVWPLVRSRRPDARLLFVGASPTRRIRNLAASDRSIEVTGTVPDVRPHLWNAAAAVVPLATARGLQNKALEAIAAGLPVVITPCVRDGLPASVAPACAVAEEPRRFADAVLELLSRPPADRRQLAARADLSALSWSSQLQPLLQLLESVRRRAHARTA